MMQRCWQISLPLARRRLIPSLTSKRTAATEAPLDELDAFEREYLKQRIQITPFQRLLLGAGSSLASLLDPHRHDMIACLGETTGENALWNILDTMQASEEGRRILVEKPRINTRTIDLKRLEAMPPDTFGATYAKFLKDNNVTPDTRMEVHFLDDPKLAYVMTRYRECHDLVHAVLNMPTNMLCEVTVKWVEALNTGLPMCYGGAVFGAVRLRPKQRREYLRRYLPWAIENSKQMKPLMPIYWERRWEQNVDELRNELGIKLLQ
ncbi:ubiquinone biosynthesis protein COQ4 homolog, mitochondrial [Drosophila grimshawi]|uniref:Ubiquinone biosynthesis protein COQ4 homolog, mitochondrial n=1 Tax=Drosophila grimshawi TaxID=7222 RepID=COQ4_DROGR|nr:ubiquinone biosynthesis protein COQ4 homolog, mitochondrial [Drosophila grimshawi]XP_043071236.1 ubiquinone biosynthesis protein COQ4 homolog, mitochondrial [Drosophila grimshawi]B4J252.1 RecName: Full=Ubiquinone biosynthesis protein COQ4 homolog, mitochondrial; AltName: Full=Coenzyme Q biosynthesis protein 4 homolog; Flags: Precursor [Drosophila grimshawi]EDV97003.1 GH14907 [Drosophila grimshawi]